MGIDAESAGDDGVLRRSGVLAGVTVGLAVSAAMVLAYAWLRRTPQHPFVSDRGEVTNLLWRTTAVVAAMAVIVVGHALLAWARPGTAESDARRLALLRYVAPTLALIALLGWLFRRRAGSAEAFRAAEWQQGGLDATRVTSLAALAWWCACLAVLGLAATSALGYVRSASRRSRRPRRAALIAAFTVLVVGALASVALGRPLVVSELAAAHQAPQPQPLTGAIAYDLGSSALVPGGPGYVQPKGQPGGGLEGVDGATGQVRWSFSQPGVLSVADIGVTGPGADGVAVVSASYRGRPVLIGLDATTGTPLWTKPGSLALRAQRQTPMQMSTQVVLTSEQATDSANRSQPSVRWVALSPRTGATLWTQTLPMSCDARLRVTRDAVVVPNCDSDRNLAATVLDAATGQVRSELTSSGMGVDAGLFQPQPWLTTDARSDLVVVSYERPDQFETAVARIVDVRTGRVTRPLPDNTSADFVDPASLVLRGPAGQSILDLSTGSTIATGIAERSPSSVGGDLGGFWARWGDQWVTFLPAAGAPGTAGLKIFDATAPMRTIRGPCPDTEAVPLVEAVPGALLVSCGKRSYALR